MLTDVRGQSGVFCRERFRIGNEYQNYPNLTIFP